MQNSVCGNFDVSDVPWPERPLKADDDEIKAILESNPLYTTRDIAEALYIAQSAVHDHLKKLGFVRKLED